MRHLKSFKKFENFDSDEYNDINSDEFKDINHDSVSHNDEEGCAFCDGEGCTECDHGHEKRFSRIGRDEFDGLEDDENLEDEFGDDNDDFDRFHASDLDEDRPLRERRNSRLSRNRRILEKKKADKKEDEKKSKTKKSSKKEDDEEVEDKKSSKGLTAAQKKLPAGLQKAILARKKK